MVSIPFGNLLRKITALALNGDGGNPDPITDTAPRETREPNADEKQPYEG